MAQKAVWKGSQVGDADFEYLNGIPARTLSDEEYEALDTEQKRLVRSSPLYDVKSEGASKEAPK
jgi:hypothetical protein